MAKWAAEGREEDSDDDDDKLPDESEPASVPAIPEDDPTYYCKVHAPHSWVGLTALLL